MANSAIAVGYEQRLADACEVGNYLDRRGVMTDALLAAATGVEDLIADLYAALLVGTNDKFDRNARIAVRYFEQQIRLLALLDLLTDVQVAALTSWDAAAADTSFRHLFAKWVTLNGFSPAAQSGRLTAIFAQGVAA